MGRLWRMRSFCGLLEGAWLRAAIYERRAASVGEGSSLMLVCETGQRE